MELAELKESLETELSRLKEAVSHKDKIDPEDFNMRGELYRMSSIFGPTARNQDLIYMKQWIQPKVGEVSVDMAAGTGFITKPLAEWTQSTVFAVDPSEVQLKNCAKKCEGLPVRTILGSLSEMSTLEKIGKDLGNVDLVTSFGGIHHVIGEHSQKSMFTNVSKILKDGGRFVAADVGANTKLSEWFEKVVKKYCLTGHEEEWLSHERLQNELIADTELKYVKSEIVPLQWVFETKTHMALFMKALNALDLTEEETIQHLGLILGFEERDGKVYLNWPMIFFDVRKINK
jgi:ubiquinone/menaquinone biosynthesis C-methylase UbiE